VIQRKHRFHGRGSLNYVYTKGKSVRGPFISLKFAPSNRDDYRAAVVVSKKVSKSAVVRNRIRRRIYEVIRRQKKQTAQPWKVDLVLTVFDETVATMPAAELEAAVVGLLHKAAITRQAHP
jgi:ribonuclease P protein component